MVNGYHFRQGVLCVCGGVAGKGGGEEWMVLRKILIVVQHFINI